MDQKFGLCLVKYSYRILSKLENGFRFDEYTHLKYVLELQNYDSKFLSPRCVNTDMQDLGCIYLYISYRSWVTC